MNRTINFVLEKILWKRKQFKEVTEVFMYWSIPLLKEEFKFLKSKKVKAIMNFSDVSFDDRLKSMLSFDFYIACIQETNDKVEEAVKEIKRIREQLEEKWDKILIVDSVFWKTWFSALSEIYAKEKWISLEKSKEELKTKLAL